jgi:hypothetical protein
MSIRHVSLTLKQEKAMGCAAHTRDGHEPVSSEIGSVGGAGVASTKVGGEGVAGGAKTAPRLV